MNRTFLNSLFGALFGLGLGLGFAALSGESPLHILRILGVSCFGSGYDFGMTLFYTAPLILTGLAVSIPYRAGLFNIGAEGQLTMGAIAAAASSTLFPGISSPFLAVMVASILSFLGGGVWGGIAGFLKARRESSEVITTIMLNFIAAGISSFLVLYVLKDPQSSIPETVLLPEIYSLKPFAVFNGAPMGVLFFVIFALPILLHFWFQKSAFGYEVRAMGENPRASEIFGIQRQKIWPLTFFLAGGLAGLVGVVEVLGNSHRFKIGFSADYGFVGIAVALLARGNFLGILPAAILMGMLQKGSASLDLETDKITRDLSYVIEGLMILGVASTGLWERLTQKKESP